MPTEAAPEWFRRVMQEAKQDEDPPLGDFDLWTEAAAYLDEIGRGPAFLAWFRQRRADEKRGG